jgi:murein DD-endopeptidase MepM/ murein hydrolase activator NlpD
VTLVTGTAATEATAASAAIAPARDTHDTRDTQQRTVQGGSWAGPLSGGYRVTKKYGVKGDYIAGHHTGVDLAVPTGTPVRSVGRGRVVFAGRSGDYGKAVTIRMRDGKYTLFAHLSRVSVRKGHGVRPGSYVGRSGNTGRSTGPHLHFEVRAKRGYGSDISPVIYLARKGLRVG